MIGQNTDLIHEITVTINNEPLDIGVVELVEVSFGSLIKMYPSQDVTYENGVFCVHLTQEDTQTFDRQIPVQVRVKFDNGNIVLSNKKFVDIKSALSKEVI